MRTAEQVRDAILERTDEVVEDLQHLLENSCCNDCQKCEYQYLCVRDQDY